MKGEEGTASDVHAEFKLEAVRQVVERGFQSARRGGPRTHPRQPVERLKRELLSDPAEAFPAAVV
ncbi:MAG: hypothetical protein U0163_21275 [Gemmatimonadaceae bacterium]